MPRFDTYFWNNRSRRIARNARESPRGTLTEDQESSQCDPPKHRHCAPSVFASDDGHKIRAGFYSETFMRRNLVSFDQSSIPL